MWDAASQRCFATLAAPDGAEALLAFDAATDVPLDSLPSAASFPDGLALLAPASSAADEPGGAVAVSRRGRVSLHAAGGAEAASWAPNEGCSVLHASVLHVARGLLCVSVLALRRPAARRARTPAPPPSFVLSLVSLRTGEAASAAAAEVCLPRPDSGADSASVDQLRLVSPSRALALWSDGSWVLYDTSAAVECLGGEVPAAAVVHARRLACFPRPAAGAAKKRPAQDSTSDGHSPRAAMALFGQNCSHALCVSARNSDGPHLAFAALDLSFAAVAFAGAEPLGGQPTIEIETGVQLSLLPRLTLGGAAGGAVTFSLFSPSHLFLVLAHPPRRGLASALGGLASPAARLALGPLPDSNSTAGAHSPLLWRPRPVDGRLAVRTPVERVVEVDRMAAHDAALPPAAGALLRALADRNSDETTLGALARAHPRCLAAALSACLDENESAALHRLLSLRLLPLAGDSLSFHGRNVVSNLLAAGKIETARLLLSQAADVSGEDLSSALSFSLAADVEIGSENGAEGLFGAAGASDCAGGAEAAKGLLSEAEHSFSAAAAAAASPQNFESRLALAKLLAAAVEGFAGLPPGRAALLFSALAAKRDDGAAAFAAARLPLPPSLALLEVLNLWLRIYRTRAGASLSAGSLSPGIPSLAAVLSWAAAVLDQHFQALLRCGGGGETVRRLAAAAAGHSALVGVLARLGGAAGHLARGGALPAPRGTVSSLYAVEKLRLG